MKSYYSDSLPPLSEHEQNLVYCGLDSCMTNQVAIELKKQMDDIALKTYDFERSLYGPVTSLMKTGFKINSLARDELVEKKRTEYNRIEAFFKDLVKHTTDLDINYKSVPQLLNLFYTELGLPPQYSSKRGEHKEAADRKALETLIRDYVRAKPYANAVLKMRDLKKSIDSLTQNLGPGERWYAGFNIGGTDTGRWSSSEHPLGYGANLLNIDDEDRPIFIPDQGYVLISCDQQGADARLVAYLSGDENYIEAVESGDVHTKVASMVWGFEPTRANSDRKFYRDLSYREVSKKFTHGTSYLGSAYTLASQARTELKLAEEFQKKFFKAFPGIKEWQEYVAYEIQTKGYLITPFNRRRYFWGRLGDDATIRAAVAYSPQSAVGDLTARGCRIIWERYGSNIPLLNNVYDAVVVQAREEELDTRVSQVLDCISYPFEVTDIKGKTRICLVPWEPSIGLNWGKVDGGKNPGGLRELKGTVPSVALGELKKEIHNSLLVSA